MEFTVIGDAVNVTWKLQELTKELGANLTLARTSMRWLSRNSNFGHWAE